MGSIVKLVAFAIVAVLAAIAANFARDLAYQVNALTVVLVAAGFFVYTIRSMNRPAVPATGYMDDVVRAGVSPPPSGAWRASLQASTSPSSSPSPS